MGKRIRYFYFLFILVMFLTALCINPIPSYTAPIVLKISHSEKTGGGVKDLAAVYLAKLINERSKGALKVEIYPAGQLYGDAEGIVATANGTIFCEATSSNPLSAWTKGHAVFSLWGLFQDQDHVKRYFDSPCGGGAIEKELGAKGLLHLPVGPLFVAYLFSNRLVKTAADVEGLRLRVMESPLVVRGAKVITGVDPVVIPVHELYTAAAQRMVEGTITGLKAIESRGIQEFFNYCVISPSIYNVSTTLVMSKIQLGKLPRDMQKIVMDAIKETYDYTWSLPVDYFDKDSHNKMVKEGVTFTKMSPEEFNKLMGKYEPVFEKGAKRVPAGYVVCAKSLRK
jgi:C4-dicarboxylate-binding protein DctP